MSRDHGPSAPDGDPALRVGALVEAKPSGLALDGRAVAHIGGRALHVYGLLPGEVGRVRVDALDRGHDGRDAKGSPRAHGSLDAVLSADPARRDAPCQHAGRCTGCPWMPWAPSRQREALRRLLAGYGLDVDRVGHVAEVGADPASREAVLSEAGLSDDGGLGYRWSAKRVAGRVRGRLVLGSYRRRSHEVADMAGCLVDHPRIAAAADELARAAASLPVAERPGAAGLRGAWFKTDGARVLTTIITSVLPEPVVREVVESLTASAGVAWSQHTGQGNAVRGAPPVHLRGCAQLQVEMAGVPVPVGPLGFLQPNPAVAARCYQALVSDPQGAPLAGDRALDLYAGAGVTTALLRRHFVRVDPCESWPESAALLGVPPMRTADFLAALEGPRPELVVANPPRAGLGQAVVAQLNALAAPRLHLMSCSPRSLRRDLDGLAATYRVASLEAWATLPQTPHVELVARLVATG